MSDVGCTVNAGCLSVIFALGVGYLVWNSFDGEVHLGADIAEHDFEDIEDGTLRDPSRMMRRLALELNENVDGKDKQHFVFDPNTMSIRLTKPFDEGNFIGPENSISPNIVIPEGYQLIPVDPTSAIEPETLEIP